MSRRFSSHLGFCALLMAALSGSLAFDALDAEMAVAGEREHEPDQAALLVHYDAVSGNLGVKAEQSEVGVVLRTVAEQAGIGIEMGPNVSCKVTVAFSGLPLEEGIKRIVEAGGIGNFAVEYTRAPGEHGAFVYKIEKFSIHGGGTSPRPVVQQPSGSNDSAGTGTGGAFVDQAQRERRTTTGSPESRNQMAHFNPKRSGAGVGVPVQQFPHPLRVKGPRELDGSGDEQRVHSLMNAAQRGDAQAIDLLGQSGSRQAAPVLARIVTRSPEGSPARKAATAALSQLGTAQRNP